MRNRIAAAFLLLLLSASATCHAAVDDIENNADLQPTVEERARDFVLKRWPGATEIQVFDMTEEREVFDADDFERNDAAKAPAADPKAPAEKPEEGTEPAQAEIGEDATDWCVSVMFKIDDVDHEILMNDECKVLYRYEGVDLEKIPEKVAKTLKKKFADMTPILCDKLFDDRGDKFVMFYVVSFDTIDVYLDAEGEFLRAKETPQLPEDDAQEEPKPSRNLL
jgi:hypothetical protein